MQTHERRQLIKAGIFACLTLSAGLPTLADISNTAISDEKSVHSIAISVQNVAELEAYFRQEQVSWNKVAPPDATFIFQQGDELVEFDAKQFPPEFNDGLISTTEYGCPIYPVIIAEDPVTREAVFANTDGKEIYALPPAKDYNPYLWAEQCNPDLYSGLFSLSEISEIQQAYDPRRILIKARLLPKAYADKYAKAVAEAQQTTSVKPGGGMVLMRGYSGPAVTNLVFTCIERKTNGIMVTLAYPADFTNRLDFLTTADLISSWWDLGVTTNVNTSTNWIEWLDTSAFSVPLRFYVAGNADQDSDTDGLSDLREQLMYHTVSTNTDTDADGLGDYTEVMNLRTDPNNPDTNAPTAWIDFPVNLTERTWTP